jgi:hypothetical protein
VAPHGFFDLQQMEIQDRRFSVSLEPSADSAPVNWETTPEKDQVVHGAE